ncbi:hypothetical protein MHBO_004055, partial [Bonamia ostreae]
GPKLYFVDDEGSRLENDIFSCGSGSTHAYGVVDTGRKEDMNEDEAIELAKRSIYHATHRDPYSGGVVRVFVISKNGHRTGYSADMNDLHELYDNKVNQ